MSEHETWEDDGGSVVADPEEERRGVIHCSATTALGERCRAPATADGLCFVHSPLLSEKRFEARRHGGRRIEWAKRLGKDVKTIEDVFELLDETRMNLQLQDNTHQAAGAMVRLAEVYLKAIELRDVTAKVGELEEMLRKPGGDDA